MSDYICPNCHRRLSQDELTVWNEPGVWSELDGGRPPESGIACPFCQEEITEDDVIKPCKLCGEDLYTEHKGYFMHRKGYCEECAKTLKDALKGTIDDVSKWLSLTYNAAAEAIFDFAEQNNWMEDE